MSAMGESLLLGVAETLKYTLRKQIKVKVHKVLVPKHINVKAIRLKLNLTQQEFTHQYGFSVRTLEKWEQGIREPDGPARAYLIVIDGDHKAVETALAKKVA